MQIAVADVGDVRDQDVVPAGDLLDMGQHVRYRRDRYAYVLCQYRTQPLERRVREAARSEERSASSSSLD